MFLEDVLVLSEDEEDYSALELINVEHNEPRKIDENSNALIDFMLNSKTN